MSPRRLIVRAALAAARPLPQKIVGFRAAALAFGHDAIAAGRQYELKPAAPLSNSESRPLDIVLTVDGQNSSGREGSTGSPSPRDFRVQRVVEHIDAHLGEELTLAELAKVAGLSPHYFGSVFRAATGLSLHRYVMKRRIERACELLAETDDSVTTIALELGFSSHAHFTTTFRRFMGLPPSQFKARRRTH
jgi:AraC-like DNA-binding protein